MVKVPNRPEQDRDELDMLLDDVVSFHGIAKERYSEAREAIHAFVARVNNDRDGFFSLPEELFPDLAPGEKREYYLVDKRAYRLGPVGEP